MTVTLDEAREQLENVLQRAAAGETITVTKGERILARIRGVAETESVRAPKQIGDAVAAMWLAPDLDDLANDFADCPPGITAGRRRARTAGAWIVPDFEEPLEDFKNYM